MAKFSDKIIGKFSKLSNESKMRFVASASREAETLVSLLNSFPSGFCVCGESGNLQFFNKSAERFLQFDRNLSRKFTNFERNEIDFFSAIGNDEIRERLKKSLDYKRNQNFDDIETELSDGKKHILTISTMPLVRDNCVAGLIVQIDDVTESREQEKALYQMKNLANLTGVAANLAHEIKNPLAAMSIYIQLLQRELAKSRKTEQLPPAEKAEKYLETVSGEIKRLNSLVIDFLSAVRPVQAALCLVDAIDVLREVAEFFSLQAKERKVSLELDFEPKTALLKLDRALFKEVVVNLVVNAFDAMPQGGKLALRAREKDGKFRLFVQDTGEGIDEASLPHIFEPYWTTKANGTGLGLAMAYKIVQAFGGKIEAKSAPCEGATFEIELPVPQKETHLLPNFC